MPHRATMDNFKESKFVLVNLPEGRSAISHIAWLIKNNPDLRFLGKEEFNQLKWNPNIPDNLKIEGVIAFFGDLISGDTKKHTGDLSISVIMLGWDPKLEALQYRGVGSTLPFGIKNYAIAVDNRVD